MKFRSPRITKYISNTEQWHFIYFDNVRYVTFSWNFLYLRRLNIKSSKIRMSANSTNYLALHILNETSEFKKNTTENNIEMLRWSPHKLERGIFFSLWVYIQGLYALDIDFKILGWFFRQFLYKPIYSICEYTIYEFNNWIIALF